MLPFLLLLSFFVESSVFGGINIDSTCINQENSVLVYCPMKLKYDQLRGENIDLTYSKSPYLASVISDDNKGSQTSEFNLERLAEGHLGVFDMTVMTSVKIKKMAENLIVSESDRKVFVVDLVKSSSTWRVLKKDISIYGIAKHPNSL